jgi:hypothetical protein
MNFNDFLDKVGASKRNKIRKRLNDLAAESSIMQQMVQNLYSESRLKRKDWEPLAESLMRATSGVKKTEQIIRNFCRDGRCLKGGIAKVRSDTTYGRIVSFEYFCELLVKLDYHVDIQEAKANIRSLIGCSLSKIPDKWKEWKLARFFMWSTFNLKGRKPFGKSPLKSALILCMLGITPKDGPFIILEYRLPNEIKPFIPTFCDAYAADFWSRYFRPAPPGAPYGRTMPTDTCPTQKGCPEVVHEVIQLNNLVKPLREAV